MEIFSSRFRRSRVPIDRLFHACRRVPLLRRATLSVTRKGVLSMKTNDNYRSLTLGRVKGGSITVSVSPLSMRIVRTHKLSTHLIGLFSARFIRHFSAVLVLVGNSKVVNQMRGFNSFFRQVGLLLGPNNYVLVSSDSLECLFRRRSKDFIISLTNSCCNRLSFRVRCGRVGKRTFS